MRITDIHARQILDSRGNPTVEADVTLDDGTRGRAAVPSGASTGSHEAIELRDGGEAYGGKAVTKAVTNVNTEIREALVGEYAGDQPVIDAKLIELDGTPNKARLGANAMLAVSLACARAASASAKTPLYRYVADLAGNDTLTLPLPMMNIINGGKHAAGSTDIQEFMVMPVGAKSFSHCIQMGSEIFHALAKVLAARGYGTTVGDEGGYAPAVKQGNAEALELISQAVAMAGYKLGVDVVLALDVASTELIVEGGDTKAPQYKLNAEGRTLSSADMIGFYRDLTRDFPIVSIEDGLGEDDWKGWKQLNAELGSGAAGTPEQKSIQLVGDDLFVTNTDFLRRGISEQAANAILIKVNQIGTLTETIDAVKMAQQAGWNTVMSHRSGETEDTTIAHLAVGLNCGQIKTGSLSRTDRVAKYNELMRIEEELGADAVFAGRGAMERTSQKADQSSRDAA
jgi:enolase